MDKEGNSSPWLAGAAVTILVALIGAYATIKASQSRSEPSPKPPAEPQRDLVELYGPQLKNAIDLASTAEVQAVRDLNESPLSQIYRGTALKMRSAQVEELRRNGVFALAQREGISYGKITVDPDERHARVRVTPVWELVFFSGLTRQCVGRWPPYEAPQTVDLERTESGWMVDAIVFDSDTPQVMHPCR
jgi:hypothetical protein